MPEPGSPLGSRPIPSGSHTAARTYSANGISARVSRWRARTRKPSFE